ncbi:actin-like protein ARP9 [Echria macrotheca]|uniref:Actin-like protein ARP9 n=1 Tax=Echria macrotheca TaxID=438768 RepID=A0AAJ0B7B3_9PEZI|nr:actin-like protein ARP9 [Echria macrotheca]
MSGQTGKWREEQILIICPGSQTTMAQIGCSELTPPARRFPTRMFKDQDSDDWRPYHTYKRKKAGANGNSDDDWEYVEDVDSTEGAVYPIRGGRIVNMDAFLAFLEHVHGSLTTTYHNTPIILMASPQWTRPDCENIARYIFEKTKTPALCLINSGIATQYGLRWANLTVVDVGFEKVDVTCIYDSRVVSHVGVGACSTNEIFDISGGEVFTRKLMSLLESRGFDHEMAEQLKKSNICEVLPYTPDAPELMDLPLDTGSGPTADVPKIVADDDIGDDSRIVDDEGVLDVANIVASGQTREFLAKQEKLKAEKAKPGRKGKDKDNAADAAAKAARLPNSKRSRNMFHYEELVTEEVPVAPPPQQNGTTTEVEMSDAAASSAAPAETADAAADGEKPQTEPEKAPAPTEGGLEAVPSGVQEPETNGASGSTQLTERVTKRVRRDIEIGLERFLFADRVEVDRIVTAIYRAIQGIGDMYMRPSCWENIVFVGNGSRIRGLKENIMQTLQARHLVSPSSATMFTSELPSNIGTPSGTGSQTPTGSFTGAPHQLPTASSVNPLLQAATTANLGVPGGLGGPPGGSNVATSNAGDAPGVSHHFHSQTPTSIKQAAMPTYLSEWSKNGFEEAMFLGAQVAARLAFCIHNLDAQGLEAQRLMSLSRVDYK